MDGLDIAKIVMVNDYINKVDIELLMKNHLPEEFCVPIVRTVLINSMKAAFLDGMESSLVDISED